MVKIRKPGRCWTGEAATAHRSVSSFGQKVRLLEGQDGDVLRECIQVTQALMATEGAGLVEAERHERTGERTAHRNGGRNRTWERASAR